MFYKNLELTEPVFRRVCRRVCRRAMYNYPDFNYPDHDLSILTLSSPLQMSKSVSPVCLPPLPSYSYTGVIATVSGGRILSSGGSQPDSLMGVNVSVIGNTVCNEAYVNTAYEPVTESMICARDMGQDSCNGDSGSKITLYDF